MNNHDPVSDFLTRIRNAQRARHQVAEAPRSKLKLELARILKEEGYIRNFKVVDEGVQGKIKLLLKYRDDGRPAITGLERVSRPGRRLYAGKSSIPVVFGGLGITILSTSRGLMTGQQSQEMGVGGEVLCSVW